MHNYQELKIWQEGRKLVKEIYTLSAKFLKDEMYGLISQIRRASISISSNIAEGTGRDSNKDFLRFLNYSIGSLFELETEMILSKDLGFINTEESELIYQHIKQ